jgi:GTP-binding protein
MMRIESAVFTVSAFNKGQLPRPSLPEIAMVGRSNVGKSSLINRFAGRKGLARISSTPGKTQSINFYLVNETWYLVDLPGYGYARVAKSQRASWGKLIEGYLTDRSTLRGLVHLVDIRHPPMESDVIMQDWVRSLGIPTLVVATKLDKIPRGKRLQHLKIINTGLRLTNPAISFSAVTGEGLNELTEALSCWQKSTCC